MWINGEEDDVEALDAGQLEEELLAEQYQSAKDGEKPKHKRKKLLAEINAVAGVLESHESRGDGGVTANLLQQRIRDMEGALAVLDSKRAAEDVDDWSASSESDAEEAPAPDSVGAGGAGQPPKRVAAGNAAAAAAEKAAEQLQGGLEETERERHVRLGLITPFQSLPGLARGIVRREGESTEARLAETAARLREERRADEAAAPRTRRLDPSALTEEELRPTERQEYFMPRHSSGPSGERAAAKVMGERRKRWRSSSHATDGGGATRRAARTHVAAGEAPDVATDDRDDADSDYYEERIAEVDLDWAPQGDAAVRSAVLPSDGPASQPASPGGGIPADGMAAEAAVDVVAFDGGFQLPSALFRRLFPYQQVGVQWLWELHQQRAGGIMGDEMGLGKTIQLICFLGGLHFSGKHKPALIVAPVTTLQHWLREIHTWYPRFRVIKLHNSNMRLGDRSEVEKYVAKARRSGCGVILTGYEVLRRHADVLLPLDWGYVCLDEGHKISNPDAEITLLCKQVRTAHRVILSGTPIQNRLTELWSLFDFVFPGKLGTLPVFQAQFGLPIQQGTYSSASAVAVTAAYKCAVMLRDMMSPYLLRRTKADVAKQLPKKTEQVLLCSLSPKQRQLYQSYVHSREVEDILAGRRPAMEGITVLRKICNHADLLHRTALLTSDDPDVDYGALPRSSKLQLAMQVLEKWRAGGHKALLFTQTQQMLDIIERHIADAGMRYLRMDGSVPPKQRFRMIDHFNRHPAGHLPPDTAGQRSPPLGGAHSDDDAAADAPDASAAGDACDPPAAGGSLRSAQDVPRVGTPDRDAAEQDAAAAPTPHAGEPSGPASSAATPADSSEEWADDGGSSGGEISSSEDDFDGGGGPGEAPRPRRRPRKRRRRARADGASSTQPTSVGRRRPQSTADEDEAVFVFLLTTKVGGLGVNLTAADRVLLFDPDWNPATDIQARERCWRLGQKRPVTIYRLITRGSIEEKVYHRQIYKHALSTRVLSDPRQKRYVAQSGLRELFTLTDQRAAEDTETGRLWQQLGADVVERSDVAPATPPPATRASHATRHSSPRSSAATTAPTCDSSPAEADPEQEPPGAADTGEARLLQELFAGTEGLHSALDHSAVEEAGGAERRDVERRAAAVAKQAAAAVAASRAARQHAGVHIPTWTGRAGEGGAPAARPRFGSTARATPSQPPRATLQAGRGGGSAGVSSAAVIARLKARDSAPADEPVAGVQEAASQAQDVLAQVVAYLSNQPGGCATSERILTEFATAAERVGPVLFRQTLKQAAALDKRRGLWVLRPAFQ